MSEAARRWQLILIRQVEKTLHRLPKPLLQRIDQALLALAEHPRPTESHPLAGYDNLYRLPVEEWRITYAVEEERLIVLILEIAAKQQPERYRFEEEIDESPSASHSKEWMENASLPEDFYKVLINQVVEDDIHRRTLEVIFGVERIHEFSDFLKRAHQEKIRLLIVDNISATREKLNEFFSAEPDIEVIGAVTNGEEAIQMAVELQPDVVLMEIILPGISGLAACETISQRVPAAKIIMMSAYSEPDFHQRSMLAGAEEFLSKAVTPRELMSSIRRVYQSAALQERQSTTLHSSLRDAFKELKERLRAKLMAELDPAMDVSHPDEVRRTLQDKFEQILAQENIILSRSERERLFEDKVIGPIPGPSFRMTGSGSVFIKLPGSPNRPSPTLPRTCPTA